MLVGTIGVIIMLIMAVMGVPVAIALLLVGAVGLISLIGLEQTLACSAPMFYNYVSNYSFSVIPMFILMGSIGYHSNLFSDIFDAARKWCGKLPAGLAISVVIAQTIFGACSGSTVAACAVIGQSAIPTMRKMGYPDTLTTGVVAGSGTLAALIPPSITMCVYGLIVDESIGKLLIAGILPGAVTAIIYVVMLLIQSRKIPRDHETFTFKEKLYTLRYLWVVVALIIAIIGGIYGGVCTPTEGGAFGAFVVFLLALFSRRLNWNVLWQSLRTTVITTGMILIIIVAAMLFARFLTLSGFSRGLTEAIIGLHAPALVTFLIVAAVYLVLGCFVGSTGMMVMTLPMFYPMMMELGFDSLWFGVVVVMFCEMAYETPPVGVNLFATKSVAGDIPLSTIIRGTIPFVIRDLMAVGVIYLIPQIVTFLPSLM